MLGAGMCHGILQPQDPAGRAALASPGSSSRAFPARSAVLPGEEHPSPAAVLAKALGMEAGTVHEYELPVVLQCPSVSLLAKCNTKTYSVQPGR